MTAQNAKRITEALLRYVNRTQWKVRITSMDNHAGLCAYRDKELRLDVIHIMAEPDAEVLDTIAHEVAHAIIVNEPDDGNHGPLWKETYEELRDWLNSRGKKDSGEWLGEMPEHMSALLATR